MSREDWICIVLMILGITLFLYGANYYSNTVGWTGVFLFVAGVFGFIAAAAYKSISKKEPEVEGEREAESQPEASTSQSPEAGQV